MPSTIVPSAFVPSPNVAGIRASATIAVATLAAELRAAGRSILDFGAGQPDFDTPAFIRHAAAAAVEAGATRYTSTDGILPLRQAAADQAAELSRGRFRPEANQVVISTGSKQALFNACFSLFGAGDEVLVPVPGWTSYVEIVRLARASAVGVEGDPADDLRIDPDRLAAAATTRTRGLILNSPSNPTGAVYSADELRAILELAAERGWWVLSDEIYRRIAYEEHAPSAWEVAEDPSRLIVIDGVAKAYAMTGWRIGWAVGPEAVARTMTALQSHTTHNAATVSQHAALAALTRREEADAAIATMVAAFRERRDAAMEVLRTVPGLQIVRPGGAFYLFMNVAPFASSAAVPVDAGSEITRRLLDEQGVAVVPGAAFGTPDWIRMSYAVPLPQVVEGARRIAAVLGAARA